MVAVKLGIQQILAASQLDIEKANSFSSTGAETDALGRDFDFDDED